jgi:chromosome segregation ATPase
LLLKHKMENSTNDVQQDHVVASDSSNGINSEDKNHQVFEVLKKQLSEKNLLLNKLKARAKAFVAESNTEKKKLTAAVKMLQTQLKQKVENETALGKRIVDLDAKLAEAKIAPKSVDTDSNSSSRAPGNNDNNNNKHTSDSSHVQLASLKKQVGQLKKENDEKDDLIQNIKNDKLQLEQLLRQGSGQQDVQLEALKQKLSNAEHDKERAENKKNRIKIELDSVVKQKTEIDDQNRKLESIIEVLKNEAKERKTATKAFKNQLTDQLSESKIKYGKVNEALHNTEAELQKMRDLFNSSQENLGKKRVEVANLIEEVSELKSEIVNFKEKHDILSKEKEISTKEIAFKIAKKEEELKSHKKKRMTAKTEIVAMAKKLETHQDLLRSTVQILKSDIAPKASEQILALKSLQNKIDELVKRLDVSYIANESQSSPIPSSKKRSSSDTKQRWQDEPKEVLSNVESEINLATDQITILGGKIERLQVAFENDQNDIVTPDRNKRRNSLDKSKPENCLSRLKSLISGGSNGRSNYAKVIDENEM